MIIIIYIVDDQQCLSQIVIPITKLYNKSEGA